MPVLLLGIASLLGFFIIVVLLWIANTLESREIFRQRIRTPAKPLTLLSITDAFDPICAILWEAPIAALELVDSAGPSGIPPARLHPIFVKAAARFPEVYEGCSFVHWLQFLERNQLILWSGYRVALTPEAREFLKYRFTTDALVEA
jgi:hypothetical protein